MTDWPFVYFVSCNWLLNCATGVFR